MDPKHETSDEKVICVPATSGWPLVAAFGLSLSFAGMLTHWMVSLFGFICMLTALTGWFREVLPKEFRIPLPLESEPEPVTTGRVKVRHLQVGEGGHRARLPLRVYPYAAGLRGGIAGGAAMIVFALLYGIIFHGSIWYPVNLLAAAGSSSISEMTYEQLRSFHLLGLVLATVIHVFGSLFVGLLYGVALPMTPRHPILFGGILAPLVWSGILYSAMGIINPTLHARVDWVWFVVAQLGFGFVAGIVVAKHERIYTLQFLPFAERMGMEIAGRDEEKSDEDSK